MGKKHLWIGALVIVMVAMVGCSSPAPKEAGKATTAPAAAAPAQGAKVLRSLAAWPDNPNYTEQYRRAVTKINDRAVGRLKIDIIGGPEVAASEDQLKVVGQGTFDLTFTNGGLFLGEVRSLSVMEFINLELQKQMFADDKARREVLNKVLEPRGLVHLGVVDTGTNWMLWTKEKPPTNASGKVTSLQGLRIAESLPAAKQYLQAAGGSIVEIMSLPDRFAAVRQGVADGVLLFARSAKVQGYFPVVKFAMPAKELSRSASGVVVMNKKVFDGLAPDLQKILVDAVREAGEESYNVRRTWDQDDFVEAKTKFGVQELQLAPELAAKVAKERAALLDWLVEKEPADIAAALKETYRKYYTW